MMKRIFFHLYHKVTRESAERIKLENKLRVISEAMDKVKGKEISLSKAYEHYYELAYHTKNGKTKFYGVRV